MCRNEVRLKFTLVCLEDIVMYMYMQCVLSQTVSYFNISTKLPITKCFRVHRSALLFHNSFTIQYHLQIAHTLHGSQKVKRYIIYHTSQQSQSIKSDCGTLHTVYMHGQWFTLYNRNAALELNAEF